MIKRIDNINRLDEYKKTDLFSIRIKSLLNAYGVQYDFASFYIQLSDDGAVTSILSRLDNDITISHLDTFDASEITEFLEATGFSSCLCDDIFLPFHYDEGIVMRTFGKVDKIIPYVDIDEYPRLMDLFNLNDYDKVDFDSWYVDISHRVRHGCARAYTLNVNNEIISSAIFSSIYNDDAIITAVQTQPEFRHLGYGSALVSHMITDIRGNTYLMREHGKNKEFYESLGFRNIGKWRMFK